MIIPDEQIKEPPVGYTEIVKVFGLPPPLKEEREKWEQENIVYVELPDMLKAGWLENAYFRKLRIHRKIMYIYYNTFEELYHRAWQYIHDCGGAYVYRRKRNQKSKLSAHSWGIAIDLNIKENPYNQKPVISPIVVKIFEKYGWVWGGRWLHPDGMHFQFCKNY